MVKLRTYFPYNLNNPILKVNLFDTLRFQYIQKLTTEKFY